MVYALPAAESECVITMSVSVRKLANPIKDAAYFRHRCVVTRRQTIFVRSQRMQQ